MGRGGRNFKQRQFKPSCSFLCSEDITDESIPGLGGVGAGHVSLRWRGRKGGRKRGRKGGCRVYVVVGGATGRRKRRWGEKQEGWVYMLFEGREGRRDGCGTVGAGR